MSTDNDAFRIQFGLRLKTARKDQGMSQEHLADLAGVSRVTLSRYERGELTPPADVLSSLVAALGPNMTADWLLGSGSQINLDEDKTRIKIHNFGSVVGLKFDGGGLAQVAMGETEVRRILRACVEFESNKPTPNSAVIEKLESLIEHYFEDESEEILDILAEVVIAVHGVRLSPVWPEYEQEAREREAVIQDYRATQNIKGKGHTIAGRDVINKGRKK